MSEKLPDAIKMADMMQRFSLSRPTIRRMLDDGTLIGQQDRPGGDWIFPTNQPYIQQILHPEVASEEQKE